MSAPAVHPDEQPAVLRARKARGAGCVLSCVCAVLLGCATPAEPVAPGAPEPHPPKATEKDAGSKIAPQTSEAAPVSFACAERASAEPDELRRLTMTQYKNTLRDLTRWVVGDADEAEQAVNAAELERLPPDRREPAPSDPHGSYRRLDQAVDQTHVDESYRAAAALAGALTTPALLGKVVGACASDEDAKNDAECLNAFLKRFGARALRRPLDAEDERFYRAVYGGDPAANPAAYADVIAVMLSSPELLYFVEHGEAELPDEPGSYQLSAYELASRLSYHFWQTLPDDELWQAAADNSLFQPDVLAQQVERLMADPRTRATTAELFADWLRLDDLPALDARIADPLYAAFAGSDLPSAELRQHVIDDALDMLTYYTWSDPAGLEALFKSELSFARTEDLARIYDTKPWDGTSKPPALPDSERVGLLTRAWFLVSGSANTRPIMRGVFVRKRLLCDELAPPPANVNAVPPPLHPDKTTRQVVEELTEQRGTACASCHKTLINPLGFVFEGFDALGRSRSDQRLFDKDGARLGTLPVDLSTVPRVNTRDTRETTGPAELVELMLQSGKLEACFARNYFRFVFGRYEDMARDGCALERLRTRLTDSGRIRDMLQEAALLPELQKRRFEP